MYQFISLLWNSLDPRATDDARQLLGIIRSTMPDYGLALNDRGCIILHRPPSDDTLRLYTLPGGAGAILGRVFPIAEDEWTSTWSWSPTESEAKEIVRSHGEWLVHRMWGSYVAILLDRGRANAFVIRDCSGRIPCYRLTLSKVDLFFADPAILRVLRTVPTSLDWDYICKFLCFSHLQIRDTGLTNVTELLAGDCFHSSSGGISKHYCAWTPMHILEQPLIHQFSSAVRAVRSTVKYCINAWSSVSGTILHSLSGGLDSSVVLGCLAERRDPSTVVCFNRYSSSVIEDERTFARLAASKAKVKLLEIPIVSALQYIDDSMINIPLTAKPTIAGTIGRFETPLINEISRKLNADNIWTGQGGDHLFIQTSAPLGFVDYAALRGFRPGVFRSLHDAVHISKWNYWNALSLLWRKDLDLTTHALQRVPIEDHPFITPDARLRVSPDHFLHPWVSELTSLPPGQRVQVAALADVVNRHRPQPGLEVARKHHPLLSQPLMELCLRIPSYVHLHGGIDRAVERAAFADIVPSEIATRRQKGQATLSILEMLHRSRAYLLDLMLDGFLVKEGLLNRTAITPYLTGERPTDAMSFLPLLSSIAAELWVRNWHNYRQEASRPHQARPAHVQ